MRRRLTWLLVSIGVAALVRRLKRRGHDTEPTPAPPPDKSDPADELRQKIAESREDEPAEVPPTTDETPPTTEGTVEERRTGVHDQGRSALDEMHEADES